MADITPEEADGQYVYEGEEHVKYVRVRMVSAHLVRREDVVGFRVEISDELPAAGNWRVFVTDKTLFVMPPESDVQMVGPTDRVTIVMPRGFDKGRIVDTILR